MINKRGRGYVFLLVLGILLGPASGYAQEEQVPPTLTPPAQEEGVVESKGGKISPEARRKWQQLSPEQKQKLRKRLEQWKNLDPSQKSEIKQRFQRYQQLPPELKKKVRQNWGKIRNLPPERRQEIVEKYKRWQKLPPEKKQLIRDRHKRFQGLSPEQRQQFKERREKWQTLAPEQKQEFREKFRQRKDDPGAQRKRELRKIYNRSKVRGGEPSAAPPPRRNK